MILHVLIAMVAGWVQRHQQQVITYLIEENRVLKAQLGGRRLAALAHPLGRARHPRHPHALGQATDRPEV